MQALPAGDSSIHWGLVRPYDAYAVFGEHVERPRDQASRHNSVAIFILFSFIYLFIFFFFVVYKYIKNNTYISYHKDTHVQMWTQAFRCIYTEVCVYMHVVLYVWVCIWTCMCVPTYVSMCVYVCRSIRVCRSSHLIYRHILSTLVLGSYLYIRMYVCTRKLLYLVVDVLGPVATL